MKKAFILSIFFTIVSIALSLAFKSMTATLFSKGDLAVFYSVLDLVGLFMLLFIGFRASMTVSFHKGVEVGGMLNLFRIIIGFVAVLGCVASFFILGLIVTGKQIKRRDRKSTRLNSSHITRSRMPSSA